MSDSTGPGTARPQRFQLPNLVAGLVIGVLIAGGLAPLVGSDRETNVETDAPDFLTGGDGASDEALGPDGTATPGGGSGEADATGSSPGSSGGGGDAGPAGDGDSPAVTSADDGPRTASDVGVTPDTIRVGSMTLNCKACAALGVTNLDNVPHGEIAAAFANDINARGGINGRMLEVFTADYDPAEDAVNGGGTERAACIELTERRKVFAVLVGATFQNACVYDEHKTPMLTNNDETADDPATFNRVDGRLWLTNQTQGRTLLDWARQLDAQQLITKSMKFGLVVLDGQHKQSVDKYLLPELRRLGYTPSHISVLPEDASQLPVKAAQEVPAMRGKGVTHVLMGVNYLVAQTWLREAERNGWRPQYLQSDFPGPANDYQGGQNSQAAEAQWNGAIAVSTVAERDVASMRSDPAAKRCLDIYEKHTGGSTTQTLQGWVFHYCNQYGLFERAAKAAGVNLTRRSFVQAMASLGDFPLLEAVGGTGSYGGRYSLGAVKFSAKNLGQRKVYRKPCPLPDADTLGCYVPDGPVYRMAA